MVYMAALLACICIGIYFGVVIGKQPVGGTTIDEVFLLILAIPVQIIILTFVLCGSSLILGKFTR